MFPELKNILNDKNQKFDVIIPYRNNVTLQRAPFEKIVKGAAKNDPVLRAMLETILKSFIFPWSGNASHIDNLKLKVGSEGASIKSLSGQRFSPNRTRRDIALKFTNGKENAIVMFTAYKAASKPGNGAIFEGSVYFSYFFQELAGLSSSVKESYNAKYTQSIESPTPFGRAIVADLPPGKDSCSCCGAVPVRFSSNFPDGPRLYCDADCHAIGWLLFRLQQNGNTSY